MIDSGVGVVEVSNSVAISPQKIVPKEINAEPYMNLENVVSAKNKIKSILDKDNGKLDENAVLALGTHINDMLTKRGDYIKFYEQADGGLDKKMKTLNPQREWYKKTLGSIEEYIKQKDNLSCDDNPAWFGINTRPEVNDREENNRKAYLTVPMNEYSFIQHLPEIAEKLRELAVETDDVIKIKVPRNLTSFLAHNDSIVVHFKNENNGEEVLNTLRSWMKENNISEGKRELGRTNIAADSKENSFSGLVTENMKNWLSEYAGKYSSDILSEMAVKYAIEMSQKPPNVVKKK